MLDVLCVRFFFVVVGCESTHVLLEGKNESSLFFVFVSTEGTMSWNERDEERRKKKNNHMMNLSVGKKRLLIGFRLSWMYWLTEIRINHVDIDSNFSYRDRSKVEWMFSSSSEKSREKLNEKFSWMITDFPRFSDSPEIRCSKNLIAFSLLLPRSLTLFLSVLRYSLTKFSSVSMP